MKNTVKKDQRKAPGLAKRQELREDLKHILSPLEQAALKRNYKPFIYDYDGIALYISRRACKQLMEYATGKITFLTGLIEQERLSRKIPVKYREAFYDPRTIMDLPARLRNHLFRLGCYNLFIIMKKGKGYFEQQQGFSALAIQRLEALFELHKCGKLFKYIRNMPGRN